MAHHHFTRDDRVLLQKLKLAGKNNRQCAEVLGFHASSIGRELRRGRGSTATGYDVTIARKQAGFHRSQANQQHRKLLNGSLQSFAVCLYLARYYSPEQIAHRLKLSHSTIYRWLWNHSKAFLKLVWKFLRHKKLRRKYGTNRRAQTRELLKKRWIDDRPWHADQRAWFGHWEGDTVVGKGHSGYLVTLVERRSGWLLAGIIPKATKENFRLCAEQLVDNLPARLKRTLTLDNGREMNDYEELENHTGLAVYFAHPYHSWERGSNENANGLLRQFFPKTRDFSNLNQTELDQAVHLINTRPRKRYGYKSPNQLLKAARIAI